MFNSNGGVYSSRVYMELSRILFTAWKRLVIEPNDNWGNYGT